MDSIKELIEKNLVYAVESVVIISILVFVAYVLYSLGWFAKKDR